MVQFSRKLHDLRVCRGWASEDVTRWVWESYGLIRAESWEGQRRNSVALAFGNPTLAERKGWPLAVFQRRETGERPVCPPISAVAGVVAASDTGESFRPPSVVGSRFLWLYSLVPAESRRPTVSNLDGCCVQKAPETGRGCNARSCRRALRAFANAAASWWL